MATWQLNPDVVHLNHGSFGATPIEVLEVQQRWRALMEENPVSFMLELYQPALNRAREAVAAFVGIDSGGVVFVPNATYGVNSVLRSMEDRIPSGSEILTTNHGYNACSNAVRVSALKARAEVVTAEFAVPVVEPGSIVKAVLNGVTERTSLVVIDHVTSPTGLVMPIREIIEELEPDIPVLVDGAHAPGMIAVDLADLGASFYTANCHKWMCAPKGSGFLYVAPRHRDYVYPAAISHGYNDGWPGDQSRFQSQFDWTGTHDPTAWFSIPAALEEMEGHHDEGWEGIRTSNHNLVIKGRDIILNALDGAALSPDQMVGSIASIRVPSDDSFSSHIFDPLMVGLRHKWRIEVPVFAWPDNSQRLLRISAQQYNTLADYERLADALVSEL